ncbi:hypothetical protein [Microcoleus sp. OTE_8_concoct_300]|uniref:hypothetical protein n=1 Tax=Microcoleus sp. OTE_8_concoct_300 TaxID=2964710 RepID=UPI00403F6006
MTIKELLEIIILVIGGGGAAATGAFAFATHKYSIELKKLHLQIRTHSFESGRKQQQNIDNLTVEIGVIKCDLRDIKGVLIRDGVLHDRAGFPEENIPKRTGWTIEDA